LHQELKLGAAAVAMATNDGKALEFACHSDAQAMTINLVTTVAAR
jgi:hypothetical protein